MVSKIVYDNENKNEKIIIFSKDHSFIYFKQRERILKSRMEIETDIANTMMNSLMKIKICSVTPYDTF